MAKYLFVYHGGGKPKNEVFWVWRLGQPAIPEDEIADELADERRAGRAACD